MNLVTTLEIKHYVNKQNIVDALTNSGYTVSSTLVMTTKGGTRTQIWEIKVYKEE